MNNTRNRAKKATPPPKASNRILPIVVLAAAIIIAAVAYKSFRSQPAAPPVAAAPSDIISAVRPDLSTKAATRREASPAAPAEAAPVAQAPAPAPAPIPAPMVDPNELLQSLAAIDGKQPITPEEAKKWKDSLQQLIRQGGSSITNIQQFLLQNQDVNYSGAQGASALGYNSLRGALIDALGQIGGADADAALIQVMQGSVYPTDIASIAKILDTSSSGQYQPEILNAVQQQLAMAAMDQLGGANVGPLFQVLSTEAAAGANVASELAQYTEKWPYYSAIAMASLPNNAGVPELIQMAQGTLPGNQAAAAQALAQVAPQDSDALNTLLQMAKNGQLSDTILSQIAPFLAGREYQLGVPTDPATTGYLTIHMANGDQDFSSSDSPLSPSEITQRISMIDQVLQNVPSDDSAAQSSLQDQRNALQARLPAK